MTGQVAGFDGAPALVPGELRGYRRFRLGPDGLYPTARANLGPWSATTQQAVCGREGEHDAPGADCGCGLYGWYHPGNAAEVVGDVTGVIAARGRIILGDRGFRAAAARIEAVALPRRFLSAWGATERARRVLAQHYPQVRVYPSTRQLVRDYPSSDVRELGVIPEGARNGLYRRLALALWAVGVLTCYAVVLFLRGTGATASPLFWLGALFAFLLWQTALIALVIRMSTPRRKPE